MSVIVTTAVLHSLAISLNETDPQRDEEFAIPSEKM